MFEMHYVKLVTLWGAIWSFKKKHFRNNFEILNLKKEPMRDFLSPQQLAKSLPLLCLLFLLFFFFLLSLLNPRPATVWSTSRHRKETHAAPIDRGQAEMWMPAVAAPEDQRRIGSHAHEPRQSVASRSIFWWSGHWIFMILIPFDSSWAQLSSHT